MGSRHHNRPQAYTFPMTSSSNLSPPHPGLPSRTSILVAAARAFGSREPDESVRNPDLLVRHLIGPAELALISDHPLSKMLEQDYLEASQNTATVTLAWFMLLRTRFIDDALNRAVHNGATQIVILGAGFDTRAYRFLDLLKRCSVIEVDSASTQEYKKRRVQVSLGSVPNNLTYASCNFGSDNIADVLRQAGYREDQKTFYILEGVCMYVPEHGVRETLRLVSSLSASGSSIVLDYPNRVGLEIMMKSAQSITTLAASWGEPWIFGVPQTNGTEFFRELGFDPGVPLSVNNPELLKRYTMSQTGKVYGADVFQKLRDEQQARVRAGQSPESTDLTDAEKAAATKGIFWLAELTV